MHSLTHLRSFCALFIDSFMLAKCREDVGKMLAKLSKCREDVGKMLAAICKQKFFGKMLVKFRENVGKM